MNKEIEKLMKTLDISEEEAREIIREELDIMGIDPVYIREFKTNSGCTKFDYGSQYEFFVWEE